MAMTADALIGGFSDAPVQSARAFRTAMEAMAHPGRLYEFAECAKAPEPLSAAAATLLLVLCDPETPVHLAGAHDTPAVRDWITFHTGAPLVAREKAMFALGRWEALGEMRDYSEGVPEYPDRSATLIVDGFEGGVPAVLTGSGIATVQKAQLPEAAPFIANAARFPLGCDFFFTEEARVWALPRSTRIAEDL